MDGLILLRILVYKFVVFGLDRSYRILPLQVALDLNSVIEVGFQAVFQCDNIVAFLFWNGDLEQALVDELVVIFLVFTSSMVNVHLECEQRQLKRTGDESKGF